MNVTREQIIREIKRTAAEHGQPLGVARFFNATGIRISDWHGKYWARWGDALREAGFSINKLQEAYSEEFLLQKFIELTRELGHFPVKAELQLKRKADPSFPNDKTFGRFGSKAALIDKVTLFCRENVGFEDISELCRQSSSAPTGKSDKRPFKQGSDSLGDVYLVKSGSHHKIGRSNSAGRREYELNIQLPERANVIHKILTDDPVGIESYWHQRFADKRANGEWFKLDAEDVRAFKRRRSFM